MKFKGLVSNLYFSKHYYNKSYVTEYPTNTLGLEIKILFKLFFTTQLLSLLNNTINQN